VPLTKARSKPLSVANRTALLKIAEQAQK
jgi:hypothetical protein